MLSPGGWGNMQKIQQLKPGASFKNRTLEKADEIIELYERGFLYHGIARKTGLDKDTVKKMLRAHGYGI